MKILTRTALTAALLALAACAAPSETGKPDPRLRAYDVRLSDAGDAACASVSAGDAAAALAATNRARTGRGLAPLAIDPRLMKAAAEQACTMARTGTMTHAGPGENGPKARAKSQGYAPSIIAENIAAGPYSVGQSTALWTASPAHLQNILYPQMRHFGIGMARDAGGNAYLAGVYAAPK